MKVKEILVNKNRCSFLNVLLFAVATYLAVHLLYLIFAELNPYGLNSDLVNEIEYRKRSFEQRTLFPKDSICGNETFLMRPLLLYWLFYRITKDLLFSYQLEMAVMLLVLVVAVWWLFQCLEMDLTYRLLALCGVLRVFSTPKFSLLWSSDEHALTIVAIVVTLGCRIVLYKRIKWVSDFKNYIIPIVAVLAISAFTGYTSIKPLMMLYAPILIGNMLWLIFLYTGNHRINFTVCFMTLLSFATLILNLCFYVLLLYLHNDVIIQMNMNCSLDNLTNWSMLTLHFIEILSVLGVEGGGALFSLGGMRLIFSTAFMIMSLITIRWLYRQIFLSSAYNQPYLQEIALYWACFTVFMFFVQIITGLPFATERYYVPTALFFPVLSALAIGQIDTAALQFRYPVHLPVTWIFLCAFLLTNMLRAPVWGEDEIAAVGNVDLANAANWIEKNGYQYVTASYWEAAVVTGYTNDAVDYMQCYPTAGVCQMKPYNVMIDQRKFTMERNEPNIVLFTDEEEATVTAEQTYVYVMLRDHSEKVAEFGIYNLYAMNENPFPLIQKIKSEYTLGEEIVFDGQDNIASRWFLNGIYNSDGAAFVNGKQAEMLLHLTETVKDNLMLHLNITNIFQPPQQLQISHDSGVLYSVLLDGDEQTLDIPIPATCVKDDYLRLQFEFPDAISPAELGINEDPRELAFDITSFMLESE